MPWKKKEEGYEYDKNGDHTMYPTDVFDKPIPPMRNGDGFPMRDVDHVDWERLYEERQEKSSDGA